MLTWLGGMRNITMPNFFKTGLSKAEILQFFDFPNGRCRHLLFLKLSIVLANGVQRIKTHEHIKFWSIGCENINIFQFFKMAGDDILHFQICEISLADSVWKAQTRDSAKCRQNWSSVVETLQFFEYSKWLAPPSWILKYQNFISYCRGEGRDTSARQTWSKSVYRLWRYQDFFGFLTWRPPPSCIVEFTKFYLLKVSGGNRRITVPNFVKIGRSVAEILHFFEFSRWPLPPSWIFEIAKFYWLFRSRVWSSISKPNFVKIRQSVAKLLRFFDFSVWRPPPSCISKSWIFICC